MAELDGAAFTIQKNNQTIGTLREVSMAVSGDPVPVNGQTDGGVIRNLTNKMIGRQLVFQFSGLFDVATMRAAGVGTESEAFMNDITATFADGATITGDMVLTGYTETGQYEDAVNISGTLSTDGPWTYTAAP